MRIRLPVLSATVAAACLTLPTFADNTTTSSRNDNTSDTSVTSSAQPADTSSVQRSDNQTSSSHWRNSSTAATTSLRTNLNSGFWNVANRQPSLGSVEKGSKVLGWEVKNNQDEKLGKIEDMAVDMTSGRIVEVIIASGGFLGIGEKFYAVPPSALTYDANQKLARLNMDKDRFKSAPEFQVSKWADYSQPQQVREVYHYYGQDAYLIPDVNYRTSTWRGTGSAVPPPSTSISSESSTTETPTTSSTRSNDQNNPASSSATSTETKPADTDASKPTTSSTDKTDNTANSANTSSTANPSATSTTGSGSGSTASTATSDVSPSTTTSSTSTSDQRASSTTSSANDQSVSSVGATTITNASTPSYSITSMSNNQLGKVESAKKLIGMAVRNAQNEKIGKVDNLMVDLAAGRVVEVVVSTGGFLGMGNTLSAVPPQAFRTNPEQDALLLDVTKEQLAKNPHFDNSQWPQLGDQGYVASVYQAYNVSPYWGEGSTATPSTSSIITEQSNRANTANTVNPDNTGRNVRDRNNQNVTSGDQSNNSADIQTTARIRRAITKDSNLSVNAHNIKIITQNGRTTLRGVVNSQEEKDRIDQIAKQVATGSTIDNQLEIKQDNSSSNQK